nr:hypothetical protein GCM10020093_009430 [Planobispora longispora]
MPHFFTDARVVRSDGRDAAPGEKGEILVQGPNVMTGYWGARPLVPGEWLRTGDVARLDEDGYAYIVDRVKDMFVSGGENVYPAEVEQVILEHPAVAECAVIGVPDAVWGEVGRAVVVLRPDAGAASVDLADDILGFLRGRLAKYKIPKSVVWAGTLPAPPRGRSSSPRCATPAPPPGPDPRGPPRPPPSRRRPPAERTSTMPTTAHGLDELKALAAPTSGARSGWRSPRTG